MLNRISRIAKQGISRDSSASLRTLFNAPAECSTATCGILERLNILNASCQSCCSQLHLGGAASLQQTSQFNTSAICPLPLPGASEESTQLNPLLQMPGPEPGSEPSGSGQPGERRITVSQYGEGKAGAKLRGIRISPKKLNHFAKVIRRMHVEDALAQCQVSVKKAARFCAKILKDAVHNGWYNHGLNPAKLAVDIVHVGKGSYTKKLWPHGRGYGYARTNYFSHLEVILKESNMRPRQRYVTPLLERRRKHFPQR